MTPQSPTPGQALTEEDVKLLRKGDLLQHADGEIAPFTHLDGGWVYVDLPEAFPRDEASRFTFLARLPTAPASDVAGGVEREAVARLLEPSAWVFYDKFLSDPRMKAEIAYETRPSLAKADAIIALIRPAAPDAPGGGEVERLRNERDALARCLRSLTAPDIQHITAKRRLMDMRRKAAIPAQPSEGGAK